MSEEFWPRRTRPSEKPPCPRSSTLCPFSRSDRCPDDGSYLNGLQEEQRVLLECFMSATERTLGRYPLRASPIQASIVIPAKAQPARGEDNCLCSIMTAEPFETGIPLDRFVLQLGKQHYESGIETVRKALAAFPVKAELVELDRLGKPVYPGDGKGNEAVYRVSFMPEPDMAEPKRDEIVVGFVCLMESLKAAYTC